MKHMRRRIACFVLAAGMMTTAASAAQLHAGDLNGDDTVDAYDLALLKRDFYAWEWDKQYDCDVDGNGKQSAKDVSIMQDYLLGRTDTFSPQLSASSVQLGTEYAGSAGTVPKPDDAFRSAQMEFAVDLFRQTAQNDESTMISPLSVMLALSMTANGADTQTLSEMEQVLGGGMSMDELNQNLAGYVSRLGNQLNAANSIWFRDCERFTVSEEFLQTNIGYYDAEIYKAPFDEQTVDDINLWVEQNTDGMIDKIIKELKENDIMALINAVAFDANWESQYEDFQVEDGIFTDVSGTQQDAEMMQSVEKNYYDFGNAVGFSKDYAGYDYRFVAILPDEEMTVSEWIGQMDADAVLTELADGEYATVHAQLPKFKCSTSLNLNEVLYDMGMPTAFDSSAADFSRLGENPYNMYISTVLHKTEIDLNEKGTRAAAATVVMISDECAPMPPENTYYVTLDRPFVYMIVDARTDLPVFMGTVQSLGQ